MRLARSFASVKAFSPPHSLRVSLFSIAGVARIGSYLTGMTMIARLRGALEDRKVANTGAGVIARELDVVW